MYPYPPIEFPNYTFTKISRDHFTGIDPQKKGFTISVTNNSYNPSHALIFYEEFYIDIENLDSRLINKRQTILSNFILDTKSILSAMLQTKIDLDDTIPSILIKNYHFFLKDWYIPSIYFNANLGFWIEDLTCCFLNFVPICQRPMLTTRKFGFDIISLYSQLRQQQYSESIEELYEYFKTHNLKQHTDTFNLKKQERNPISADVQLLSDKFPLLFSNKMLSLFNNSRIVEICYIITTNFNEVMYLHYTYWRHNNSSRYQMYPRHPEPPFLIYHLPFTQKNLDIHKEVLVLDYSNPSQAQYIIDSLAYPIYLTDPCPIYLYGGIKHIGEHHKKLSGKDVYFMLDDTTTYSDIKNANLILKKLGVSSCSFLYTPLASIQVEMLKEEEKRILYFDKPFKKYAIEDILKSCKNNEDDQEHDEEPDIIYTPSQLIQKIDKERISILDPIIEGGMNTWIFAKEKAGKSILALTIAQAVAKGNRDVGPWCSSEPRKVLYIDGEMPKDKILERVGKICRAYDSTEKEEIAFDLYSFDESNYIYSGILDEQWQEKFVKTLLAYDLIIIDNYYTLVNLSDPSAFIKWMKRLNKKGVAFIILDHTNANGEIQGSLNKRRAMDLGIKLELTTDRDADIIIKYKYDRYGKINPNKVEKIVKEFTETSFYFSVVPDNTNDSENSQDEFDAAMIMLKRQENTDNTPLTNKEVATILSVSEGTVSKRLSALGCNHKLENRSNNESNNTIVERRRKIEKIIHKYTDKPDELIARVKKADTIKNENAS